SGGTWTYDYTGTALSEGSYTLEAVSGATVTQSIAIDSTAPAGPVTVNSQTTADTTPTISGTATLAAGESLFVTVNGVTYEVGDGNLGLSGSNWTLVIPASDALTPASVLGGFSGVYDVVATARDTAGNTRTDSTSAELTVQDTTAPLIDLAPSDAATVNRTVTSANGASVSLDNDASPAVIIEASDRITNLTVAVAGLKDGTSERLLFGGNRSVAANGASAAQSDILVGGVRVNVNYAGGAFTIQKSDYSALTAAEAQAVLRDIRYQDVASLPSTGARAFAFSATDDAGNVSANATSTVTVTDTIAPTLVSSTPADDATGVAVGSNLVLNFNEPVSAGTGNIVIGDGTDIHTISVGDASQVSISGNSVTINPTADLHPNSTYSVQLVSGVIVDKSGNPYAGISDPATLNFSTTDTIAPTLTASSPADDAVAVPTGSNLVLTFSEAVKAGSGSIVLSNGTDTRTIAIGDASQVTISGNLVTLNPSSDLDANTTYSIRLAGGVITDLAGNAYAGISDTTTLNFTTADTTAPGAPVVDLVAASDTGASSTDDKTSDTTPTLRVSFTGTGASAVAAADVVKLYDGAALVGSATLAATDIAAGWVEITSSALAEGTRSFTATVTDAAGNVSGASAALAVVVDATAPQLVSASVSGTQLVLSYTEPGAGLGVTTPSASDFVVTKGAGNAPVSVSSE